MKMVSWLKSAKLSHTERVRKRVKDEHSVAGWNPISSYVKINNKNDV